MKRCARWITTVGAVVALGIGVVAGCGASLKTQTAPEDASLPETGSDQDAANDAAHDAGLCPLSAWSTRDPILPPPVPRDDCSDPTETVSVVACEFGEKSPAECAADAMDGGAGRIACHRCIFGNAPDDGSDAATLPQYSTPVVVSGGMAWLNLGACLLLAHAFPDGGAPVQDQRCARAYVQQQVCQAEVCAACSAQGAVAYQECLARSIQSPCPHAEQSCGLLTSDAGCNVLHDFVGEAEIYGLRFCTLGNH